MANLHLEFIYPLFSMVLLTFVVATVMMRRRISAVQNREVPLDYFKTYSMEIKSEKMLAASRHFSNLFEIPVLFYVACTICILLPWTNLFLFSLSWGFVLARIFHAYIHLTTNKIKLRMRAFMASYLILMIMWTVITFGVLQHHFQ